MERGKKKRSGRGLTPGLAPAQVMEREESGKPHPLPPLHRQAMERGKGRTDRRAAPFSFDPSTGSEGRPFGRLRTGFAQDERGGRGAFDAIAGGAWETARRSWCAAGVRCGG